VSAAAAPVEQPRSAVSDAVASGVRKNAWTLGLLALLVVLFVVVKYLNPAYSFVSAQSTATSILPLALAAVAQAVVVISGGIDLSISSQMALTSCIAAILMKNNPGDAVSVGVVILVLLVGLLLGAVNGALVVITKVPDIIVTLATSFVWAGFALLVAPAPGGSSAQWLKDLVVGQLGVEFIPKAAVLLLVLVAIIWIPVRRTRAGLSMYAIGSNQLAAFRSGVPVSRTKIFSYTVAGLIAAFAGLSLTASTGIGTPVPEPTYVLIAIAAVVLGGVSLAGGVGGVIGPILAVVALQLIRDAMTYMRIDSNYGLVAQGVILIGVLMAGSFIQMRRSRT
jgi:ribose transport system permease protein